jgi:hypothetical protein
MAKFSNKIEVTTKYTVELSESELRALYDISMYGTENFLNAFYTTLGKHYLKQNEAGLVSLFESIRNEIPNLINSADQIRKKAAELNKKV